MKFKPHVRFRYVIGKSLFGWILRTDSDWYVRPTYDEAEKLAEKLRSEHEGQQDDNNPKQ